MTKKRKIQLLNTLGLLSVIAMMAFQNIESASQTVSKVVINLKEVPEQYFLSSSEISDLIHRQFDSIEHIPIKEINIKLLEDSIEEIPYVDNAEVYSTLDGKLTADINQNIAIARVQNGKYEFYMDAYGKEMPLSSKYSAMVPRITGNVDSTNLNTAHKILLYLDNDPFYKAFFSGITFNKNRITLYPKEGYYTVLLGEANQTEDKLEKFKIFYQNTITQENISTIDRVNLMYDKQVVYSNK